MKKSVFFSIMIWGDLKLKKYILLGIGIGIILTNSVYIWYPKKEKDINQIVEKEVQTRLKKIQDMEKVNAQIEKVGTEATSEVAIEETKDMTEGIFFGKENSDKANYYIYFSKNKKSDSFDKIQDKVKNIIDTKIEKLGDEYYLLSKTPFSIGKVNDIYEYIYKEYNIKVSKLSKSQIESLNKVEEKKVKKKTKKIEKVKEIKKEAKKEVKRESPEIIQESEMPKE